ncbi:site-specific DNA-methyltransferase [Mesorhizobium sp. LHD-90]|nr:site-specific DNA-methyltransferase [Mesorhizobium sp. LHD-90]MDQ6433688.1 site-specific DNA-methyltransferase [Mesorhizobium sp. LHD-90]
MARSLFHLVRNAKLERGRFNRETEPPNQSESRYWNMKTARIKRSPQMPLRESIIIEGDALTVLRRLPDEAAQCIITSPPYWGLRDYNTPDQIGLEPTLPQFIFRLVEVFREARRVLRDDGVFWLNVGDGYTSGNRGWRAPDKKNRARAMTVRPDTPDGLKPKDLLGIPWRLAFALQDDGWYLRADVIWHKPNAMPESVRDRPTRAHEYLFMFSKGERYFYDRDAVREVNNRNLRSVWNINTLPFPGAHFATFPPKLIEPCLRSSTRPGDFVLDPFFGSGTVGLVAEQLHRSYAGIELHPEYVALAAERLNADNRTIVRVAA